MAQCHLNPLAIGLISKYIKVFMVDRQKEGLFVIVSGPYVHEKAPRFFEAALGFSLQKLLVHPALYCI